MITPLSTRVVAIREAAKTKTASGIIIPGTEQPKIAVVKAVGPDVKTIKTGQRIVFQDYAVTPVSFEGTDYLIINEADILATV